MGTSVLLVGCGGGGGNGNSGGGSTIGTGTSGTGTGSTGGNSPYAGSYQGVSLNTSGQYAPAAGTTVIPISSSGSVSDSTVNYTSDGSTTSASGTISSTGAVVLNSTEDSIPGTLSQNSTSHVFSTAYTEANGTKGVLYAGLSPTVSPLAGSYSGTVTGATQQLPITLTISSSGAVTGTVGNPAVANQGFNFTGFVDASNNIFLAYKSGGVPSISLGSLTLSGAALSGTFQETGSDGSGGSFTASLTKQ